MKKQLQILLADLTPDATKVGMLLTAGNVGIVAGVIRDYALKNVVLDPVMISSSGKRLSARTVLGLLKEEMLPFCTVITPNIHEASVLSGIKITSKKDMEKAAVLLRALGPDTVIVTGGHLSGYAVDVVFDGSVVAIRTIRALFFEVLLRCGYTSLQRYGVVLSGAKTWVTWRICAAAK